MAGKIGAAETETMTGTGSGDDIVDVASSGPPDVMIPVATLNDLLTCNICLGYLHNAVTITECLHTFCRGCLVKYINYSLHCPKCKILIHPTDPLVNIRPDSTMQDILYKLLPQVEQVEHGRELEFYNERGMSIPKANPQSYTTLKRCRRFRRKGTQASTTVHSPSWMAVLLVYAGSSLDLETCREIAPLVKNYLWLPTTVKVSNVQNFLRKKLGLEECELALLFVDDFLLHESLSLSTISNVFFNGSKDKMITLNYGIVPNKDYFVDDSGPDMDNMDTDDGEFWNGSAAESSSFSSVHT